MVALCTIFLLPYFIIAFIFCIATSTQTRRVCMCVCRVNEHICTRTQLRTPSDSSPAAVAGTVAPACNPGFAGTITGTVYGSDAGNGGGGEIIQLDFFLKNCALFFVSFQRFSFNIVWFSEFAVSRSFFAVLAS